MTIRATCLALLAMLLAACGGMEAATGIPDPFGTPQPFQGTGDRAIISEALIERSVYVGQIDGLPAPAAESLRKEIAEAAVSFDVLASATTRPSQSLTLTGRAQGETVDFTLFDETRPLTTFRATGDPSLVAINAAQSLAIALGRLGSLPPMPEVAAASGVPGAGASPTPGKNVPTIYVGTLSGPENRIAPLKRAVVAGLADLGAAMVDVPTEGAYLVTGMLGFGPDQQGSTAVSIIWRVKSPDGSELGSAAQDNVLPTDAIRNRWPEQATLAGGAAATSVAQIIAQHFNKRPRGS